MDEWCTSPLLLEFKANYKAISENQPLPATPARPFRDYIAWLQRQNVDNAAKFWQDYLSGFNEPTPLIINKARTSEPAETGVADVIVQLSVANTQLLEQLTRQHQLTTNTFVQAALALLLRHYSGRDDIVFGVTVAGRPTALPDIEHVIGLFINSLPLRIRVQPQQQVLNWLQALLAQNLQIRQYEYVSLTQIQSWSEVPRVEGELFQHLLTFENAPIDPALRHNNDEVQMAFVDNRVHTNYPLTFVAIPGEQLCLRLTYQRDRFELATVTRMLTHFKQILDSLLHSLDKAIYEVAVIDDVERHILLEQWNKTAHSYPQPNDFIAQFEAQVAKNPHAIAVSCAGINL
jgi:non-ribosomal peptide synthetase component F